MTRAERRVAARELLAKCWQRGLKIDQVAEAMGTTKEQVSRWWMMRFAPDHRTLDRLQELAYPELAEWARERVARVTALGRELRQLDRVLERAAKAHGW
jgi:transcriptional regulator with XRE-family HTH domain